MHLQGVLKLPDGSSVPYLAARFYDVGHEWRDDSGGLGREIPHELLLLVEDAQQSELAKSHWSQAVMDVLRPVYAELYPLSRAEFVSGNSLAALAAQAVVVASDPETGSQSTPAVGSLPVSVEIKTPRSPLLQARAVVGLLVAVIALAALLGIAATATMLLGKGRPG